MIKKLLAGLMASVSLTAPAVAKIDPGTPELIRTAEQYGATFVYNTSACTGRFHGSYRPTTRLITLCYDVANANAHDTVRHEVWHFIQHCATSRRRVPGPYLTPLSNEDTLRQRWVAQSLGTDRIERIKAAYPARVHQIELEAFAAASTYTATEIASVVKDWCLPT